MLDNDTQIKSSNRTQVSKGPHLSIQNLKQVPGNIFKQATLIILALMTLFPLYFMFNSSFKTRAEFIDNLLGLPAFFTFQNYASVIQHPHLFTWFKNSFILTASSVVLATAVSIPAAFAFAKMEFKGKDTLFNLITPLMVIPPIVMIIPMFIIFRTFRLINTIWGPVVIYIGLMIPFTIYMLRNFFITIPREIEEAALIDGASTLQILTSIYIPLSRPALITSMLVNGVWVWNELLIALVFLQTDELRTLVVGISVSLQKRFTLDVPALMAGLAIVTIPMILLYILGQRALVRGLVTGYDK